TKVVREVKSSEGEAAQGDRTYEAADNALQAKDLKKQSDIDRMIKDHGFCGADNEQDVREVLEKMYDDLDIDINPDSVQNIYAYEREIKLQFDDGTSIRYNRQNAKMSVTGKVRNKIKETTRVIYNEDGSKIKRLNLAGNGEDQTVLTYNSNNQLIKKEILSNSDGTLPAKYTYTYDYTDNGVIQTRKYREIGITTTQTLDDDLQPVGSIEIVQDIDIPQATVDNLENHVESQYVLASEDTSFFGGHYLETYAGLKDGDVIELTTSNGGKVNGLVEISNADGADVIAIRYQLGGDESTLPDLYELKLTDNTANVNITRDGTEINNGLTVFDQEYKITNQNTGEITISEDSIPKSVVSERQYQKMFNQLRQNGLDENNSCVITQINDSGSTAQVAYFSTVCETLSTGEEVKIYWRLPEKGITVYPVAENSLPSIVKSFFGITTD
ncbi:MAG: hypothetical protein LUE64_06970, partial [Candidatus Gastranaerophilales bacterium]|nr:hypothetical protein [Candidatus Gastranaerophilales bacterium]